MTTTSESIRGDQRKREINTRNLFDTVIFKVRTAEPTDKVQGMVAYADGTSWNPGSGAGLYLYSGSSWDKL